MVPQETFAAMIAGLESAGLSRTEIAIRAGISRNTVWRMATGEVREPAYSTVIRVERLAKSAAVRPLEQKIR